MAFQKNGSFMACMFADVIRHLVNYSKAGKKLLILDGHSSHHDVEGLDMYVTIFHVGMHVMSRHVTVSCCVSYHGRCVEKGIHVLNLPAHTTHLLQVADISVFD